MHAILTLNIPSYLVNNTYSAVFGIEMNASIGIILLLFPLFGFLADVCLTKYKMIQLSLLFTTVSLTLGLTTSTLGMITVDAELIPQQSVPNLQFVFPISLGIIIAGIGIFEANAIQFGLDQLLEAPSTQLSAFIHWYFWSVHLGQEIFFYIASIIEYALFWTPLSTEWSLSEISLAENASVLILGLVWMSCMATCSFVLHEAKRNMYITKTGINPFKKMWKVLKFGCKNKHPLNRSAFTFCEDTTSSRLDLGKHQYGGPFTTEKLRM